jgi:hypothetical protein
MPSVDKRYSIIGGGLNICEKSNGFREMAPTIHSISAHRRPRQENGNGFIWKKIFTQQLPECSEAPISSHSVPVCGPFCIFFLRCDGE